MGQKGRAKAQRWQTAHTSPDGSHPARWQRSRSRRPILASRERDSVTGEPLRAETLKLRVRDYDRARDPDTRVPIPLSINTHQDERFGSHPARLGHYAGGLTWSPAFREYIAPVLPASIREERLACWRWWDSEYVTQGVLRAFAGQRDREAIAAILAVHRQHRDPKRAAAEYGHTVAWLVRMEQRIARYVRETYGLGGQLVPADRRPVTRAAGDQPHTIADRGG